MKQIYMQFTAGRGPVECAAACHIIAKRFMIYLQSIKVGYIVVDFEEDNDSGFRSIVIKLAPTTSEEIINKLKSEWEGTIKFVSLKNSFRPNHKRKNWFVGCNFFEVDDTKIEFNMKDIKAESMRSRGPGGQNVNKVESGVRLTHIPTGIIVKCMISRDQHHNMKLAKELMQAKLNAINEAKIDKDKNMFWLSHDSLERGGEVMAIRGEI